MADEQSRMEASQALGDRLGPAAAAALMECIPPFGWHQIATKSDVLDARHSLETRIDLRFEAMEQRLSATDSTLLGRLDQQSAKVVRWTIATVLGTITTVCAGVAAVAAIAG